MYLFFYMNVQNYCPWYKAKDSCSYILWSVNKSHEIRWKDPLKKIIVSTALTMTHSHQFSLIQSTTAASLTTSLPKLQESKGVRWPRQPAVVFCTIWELPQPPPCLCVNVWCVEVFFFFSWGELALSHKDQGRVCLRACLCTYAQMRVFFWEVNDTEGRLQSASFISKRSKAKTGHLHILCLSVVTLSSFCLPLTIEVHS